MKKIYTYFCLLFVGSLFPFLIVEFYFQDYFAVGIIALIGVFILALSITIEYLVGKIIQKSEIQNKKIDNIDWVRKKEATGKPATYFFRNRLH